MRKKKPGGGDDPSSDESGSDEDDSDDNANVPHPNVGDIGFNMGKKLADLQFKFN
jgi:hypothetical protein